MIRESAIPDTAIAESAVAESAVPDSVSLAPEARPPGPLSLAAWALFFAVQLALAWEPFLPILGGGAAEGVPPGIFDDPQMVAAAILGGWLSFLLAVLLAWRARLTARDVGWRGLALRPLAVWTGLTTAGLLATWVVAGLVFGDRLEVVEPLTRAPRGAGGWTLWIALAWTSAITEEFAMRGYGIGLLVRLGANRWVAGAGLAVLFGLLHIYEGIHAVPMLAIWGLLFAVAYLRTGSLLPGIFAHAIVNSLAPLFVG